MNGSADVKVKVGEYLELVEQELTWTSMGKTCYPILLVACTHDKGTFLVLGNISKRLLSKALIGGSRISALRSTKDPRDCLLCHWQLHKPEICRCPPLCERPLQSNHWYLSQTRSPGAVDYRVWQCRSMEIRRRPQGRIMFDYCLESETNGVIPQISRSVHPHLGFWSNSEFVARCDVGD